MFKYLLEADIRAVNKGEVQTVLKNGWRLLKDNRKAVTLGGT